MQNLTFILPARNEEKSIGLVIDEIRSLPVKSIIVVADSDSTDGTSRIALEKGVIVIKAEKGKGNAVKSIIGIIDTPFCIMMNSDYTYPARDAMPIYYILKESKADIVVGCRVLKEKGSMTFINGMGNWGLSLTASIVNKKRIYDVCSGMWGFKTDILKQFNLGGGGFILEAELWHNAVKKGCRIEQIPVGYRARLDGSYAKLKVRDGLKIGWFIIKRRWLG